MTALSTKIYCCKQFERAVKDLVFYKPTEGSTKGKWQIEGYDMNGPYPDLNYCPNCGKELK